MSFAPRQSALRAANRAPVHNLASAIACLGTLGRCVTSLCAKKAAKMALALSLTLASAWPAGRAQTAPSPWPHPDASMARLEACPLAASANQDGLVSFARRQCALRAVPMAELALDQTRARAPRGGRDRPAANARRWRDAKTVFASGLWSAVANRGISISLDPRLAPATRQCACQAVIWSTDTVMFLASASASRAIRERCATSLSAPVAAIRITGRATSPESATAMPATKTEMHCVMPPFAVRGASLVRVSSLARAFAPIPKSTLGCSATSPSAPKVASTANVPPQECVSVMMAGRVFRVKSQFARQDVQRRRARHPATATVQKFHFQAHCVTSPFVRRGAP